MMCGKKIKLIEIQCEGGKIILYSEGKLDTVILCGEVSLREMCDGVIGRDEVAESSFYTKKAHKGWLGCIILAF